MAIDSTGLAILFGVVSAVIGIAWIWRVSSRPGIVDKQSQTLVRYAARMDDMQAEIDELHGAMQADREELNDLRLEMAEWRHGMAIIFEQMKAAKITPLWTPKEKPPRTGRGQSTLAKRIADGFSIDEINGLAYDIGITPEEFAGDTAAARARELVELSHRRGITQALIGRVNELRP
jgi:hypothetical protein